MALYDACARAEMDQTTRLTSIEICWPAIAVTLTEQVTNARTEGFTNRIIKQVRVGCVSRNMDKLLEDAQIKLSSVVSDVVGVSGRRMLEALIAGQRDPRALAALAHGSMRSKLGVLTEALSGHFEDHHAFFAQTMLAPIDALSTQIEELTAPHRGDDRPSRPLTG